LRCAIDLHAHAFHGLLRAVDTDAQIDRAALDERALVQPGDRHLRRQVLNLEHSLLRAPSAFGIRRDQLDHVLGRRIEHVRIERQRGAHQVLPGWREGRLTGHAIHQQRYLTHAARRFHLRPDRHRLGQRVFRQAVQRKLGIPVGRGVGSRGGLVRCGDLDAVIAAVRLDFRGDRDHVVRPQIARQEIVRIDQRRRVRALVQLAARAARQCGEVRRIDPIADAEHVERDVLIHRQRDTLIRGMRARPPVLIAIGQQHSEAARIRGAGGQLRGAVRRVIQRRAAPRLEVVHARTDRVQVGGERMDDGGRGIEREQRDLIAGHEVVQERQRGALGVLERRAHHALAGVDRQRDRDRQVVLGDVLDRDNARRRAIDGDGEILGGQAGHRHAERVFDVDEQGEVRQIGVGDAADLNRRRPLVLGNSKRDQQRSAQHNTQGDETFDHESTLHTLGRPAHVWSAWLYGSAPNQHIHTLHSISQTVR